MKDADEIQASPDSAAFLLLEYERISKLWVDEFTQSEHRVDFFLAVASAAAGGIALLSQVSSIPPDVLYTSVEGLLIVLLLFGLTTLNRLNTRYAQLRAFRAAMNHIQQYFARRDPGVAEYLQALDKAFEKPARRSFWSRAGDRLRGTLTDLMVLSNGLICGGMVMTALYARGYSLRAAALWTAAATLAAMVVLYAYHAFMQGRLRPLR